MFKWILNPVFKTWLGSNRNNNLYFLRTSSTRTASYHQHRHDGSSVLRQCSVWSSAKYFKPHNNPLRSAQPHFTVKGGSERHWVINTGMNDSETSNHCNNCLLIYPPNYFVKPEIIFILMSRVSEILNDLPRMDHVTTILGPQP